MKVLIVSDLHSRDITSVVPAKILSSVDFLISAGDYEKYPYPISTIGVYGNHCCFDSETEILTKRGFRGIEDLELKDEVLTYNHKEHSYQWQILQNLTVENYNGFLRKLEFSVGSLMVTEDHRNIFEDCHKSRWLGHTAYSEKRVRELMIPLTKTGKLKKKGFQLKYRKYALLRNINWKGEPSSYSKDELALLAWLITEGSREWTSASFRYCVCQKNPEYSKEIEELLNRMKIEFNRIMRKNGTLVWRVYWQSNSIIEKLLQGTWKEIPKNVLNSTQEELQFFYEILLKGDGDSKGYLTTKFPILRDQFEELLLKLGYQVRHSIIKPKYYKGTNYLCSECYKVMPRKKAGFLKNINKIAYEGIIWCPTTENGFVVVRRENNVFISGNSLDEVFDKKTLINCNLKVKRIHGLKFMGVQGVFCGLKRFNSDRKLWYHNLEEDIEQRLSKMPKVDFFITHSRAKEIFNSYHDGSQAYRDYIEKKKPKYYISGHSCAEGAIERIGDTCCLNPHVCGSMRYIVLDLRSEEIKFFDVNLVKV